ncbi:MAG: ROK family protein [Thermoplasmatales archaeon]
MANNNYLGFDFGGTKITAVLATGNGYIKKRVEAKTRKLKGVSDLIHQIYHIGQQFDGYDQIGVIFPAPMSKKGISLFAPNLMGWGAVNLKAELEEAFQHEVFVDNDATAQAISVKLFDRGKKYENFVYLVVGTGIGGGIFINNEIYRGANGYAGELGHAVILANGPICGCGRRGCVESLASGRALARRAAENSKEVRSSPFLSSVPLERLSAEDIFSGRKLGDPFCTLLVDETVYYLSVAISNYINEFDPEAIFLGGGLMKNDPLLIKELKESVDRELGKYYRDVPIMKVADKTVELAPIALAIYESSKDKR